MDTGLGAAGISRSHHQSSRSDPLCPLPSGSPRQWEWQPGETFILPPSRIPYLLSELVRCSAGSAGSAGQSNRRGQIKPVMLGSIWHPTCGQAKCSVGDPPPVGGHSLLKKLGCAQNQGCPDRNQGGVPWQLVYRARLSCEAHPTQSTLMPLPPQPRRIAEVAVCSGCGLATVHVAP